MYKFKLAMAEFTAAFAPGARPKIAVDAFNQDLLKPTEHDLAANKRDGWVNPNIMGETEQELHGPDVRNSDMITSSDWGADADRAGARIQDTEANAVRHGLQDRLAQLVNTLQVAPGGQTMTVKQFLARNPITALFQSTDRSVRLMGNKIRQDLSDTLNANYRPDQIERFRAAFGSNVTDWLVGKTIQAAIHQIPDPTKLPPRDDMRSHLSDEAKAGIESAEAPDLPHGVPHVVPHVGSLEAQALSLTASLKLAWSRAILTEALRRWSGSAQMPKTPEGQVDETALGQFLDQVEKLVPPGPKVKAYMLYLCNQFFGMNPPAWQPGEDDAIIRPLMFNFDKLCTKGSLTGPQADLNGYKQLDQLKAAVKKFTDESEEGRNTRPELSDEEEAAKDRFDVHRTNYLPQDLADIQAGSSIVVEANGWAVYKIRQNPDQIGKTAAMLLCNNGINGVSWCVGRGTTSYLDQGPFYVLVKGGKSRYAISSVIRDGAATIWNPADTPVWVTTTGGGNDMPNLLAAAQERGIPLDMSKISSLPADILPILTAATQKDPELAKLVPPAHLVQGDTGPLDKAIMVTPIQGLVQDLANAMGSERSMGIGAAVMGRCIQLHYDFSPEYSMFNENLLVGYIELLAAAGQGLPKTLEDAIIQAIQGAA
jgi:hypothetical protein